MKEGETRGWQNRGGNHYNWKENPGYRTLHRWVNSNKPKVSACEHCGSTEKKLECASKTHEYTRNFDEYIWLCRRCHMLFDNGFDHMPQGKNILRVIEEMKHGVRTCIKCKQLKPISEFPANLHTTSKIQGYCKDCGRIQCNESYHRKYPNSGHQEPKSSRYVGVHKVPSITSPWRTGISVGGKHIDLGVFSTEEEAFAVYYQALVAIGIRCY